MASKDQPVDELRHILGYCECDRLDMNCWMQRSNDPDFLHTLPMRQYEAITAHTQAECNRARIEQTEFIRDEWAKWLQFPEDKDEMKISDLVNHCNILIDELQQLLKGASDEPQSM